MAFLSALIAQIESDQTVSDLVPYLVVMVVGFLVGWWGNTSRSWIAAAAGVLLVLAAIIGFIIEFPVCPSGATCSSR